MVVTTTKGYKQTDLGIIPEAWGIKSLNEISSMHGRIGWQGLKESEFTMNSEEPYLVTGMNFKDGAITWDEIYHISMKRYEMARDIQLKPNDVLMTKDGTIGKILFIDEIPYPCKASLNSHLLVFRPVGDSYFPRFLYYLLQSRFFRNHIELNKSGSTFFGISQEAVGKFRVALPKKQEQESIALSLSDLDKLINTLNQFIEKKKLIKQAAMQELLPGKKRLPGDWITTKTKKMTDLGLIPEDWGIKNLSDLCAKDGLVRGPFGGSIKKEFFVEDGIKVYEQKNAIYRDIQLGTYFIDYRKFSELKRFEVFSGDFIISCSGTIGRVYQIPENAPKGIINQALLKITLNSNIIFDKYFFYYFEWEDFQKKIVDSTQGGAMKNLVGMNEFRNTLVALPASKDEQYAIAQVFMNMDSEIEALEQERDKYKQLKVGLMQQLLTGRIRLKWKS